MSDLGGDLTQAKRVVIKIGSALLVDAEAGAVRLDWLESLAADIAAMRARGQEVLIVTSGAIAVGRQHLDLPKGSLKLEEKQAAAACGNIRLAHAYQDALARYELTVAQILVTMEDSEDRRRYLNARSTLETLLKVGAIPLINENDTIATEEIRFGDNDRLGARVAAMTSADVLVLLSDIDGLYTADPSKDPDAAFIPEVSDVSDDVIAMATGSATDLGSGGMTTKIQAAQICLNAGSHMVISLGKRPHPVKAIEEGARCTWFVPSATPAKARKRWIAGSLKPVGTLVVDAGAAKALEAGKSLLPAGVVKASGEFERGDAVTICDGQGRELARGLCAYGLADTQQIMGCKSRDIEKILGYKGREVLIHRDDLALL